MESILWNLLPRQDRRTLFALMLPPLVALLMDAMLGVALPSIQNTFRIPVELLAWVAAVTFIPQVTLMPIYGWLGDKYGKKNLVVVGQTIYLVGSLIAFTAQSYAWLLIGRVFQGIGNASFTLVLALIFESFSGESRGRSLGIWNTAVPIGMIIGPVVGGLLVESLGWRMIFALVGLGNMVALITIGRFVHQKDGSPRVQETSFDWVGSIAMVIAIGSLIMAISSGGVIGYGSPSHLVMLLFSGLGITLLAWNSRSNPSPIVRFSILTNRRFITPAVSASLRMFSHSGVRFLLVLYLANVFGYTPALIGIILLAYTTPLLMGLLIGGRLTDLYPNRIVGASGLLILFIGLLSLGLINSNMGIGFILFGMVFAAIGSGSCLVSFEKAALTALGEEEVGRVSGLFNTIEFIGKATSAPVLGYILGKGLETQDGSMISSRPYLNGFIFLSIFALMGTIIGALMPGLDANEHETKTITICK